MGISIDDFDQEDERCLELITTTYIYPELNILTPHLASIQIPLSAALPVAITFRNKSGQCSLQKISHLPPLQLVIEMPEGYPTISPPDIELTSSWIPESVTEELDCKIHRLWEDTKEGVLYAAIDLIQQGAETAFGISELESSLEEELVSFNKKSLKEVFNTGTYECGVCLGEY